MANPNLRLGSDLHADVERLQLALRNAGHELAADGDFGRKTGLP